MRAIWEILYPVKVSVSRSLLPDDAFTLPHSLIVCIHNYRIQRVRISSEGRCQDFRLVFCIFNCMWNYCIDYTLFYCRILYLFFPFSPCFCSLGQVQVYSLHDFDSWKRLMNAGLIRLGIADSQVTANINYTAKTAWLEAASILPAFVPWLLSRYDKL